MKSRKNSVANRFVRRRNQPKSIAPLSSCGLSSEVLENRELLSISLVGTVLTIVGTANNDVSAVTVFTDGQGTKFHATMNAEQFDVLVGSVASISFSGLNGDDQFTNSSGAGGAARPSTASGGSGVDTLTGSSDVDTLNGDDGNDSLHGGHGDDVLSGGNNNDSIYGQVGNDSVTGGAGDDTLNGFDGNDFYYGGDGSDNMIGGIGDDTYNFAIPSASETDTVVEAASGGSYDYLYFGGVTAVVTVDIGSTNGTVATHTNRTVSATSTSAANLEIVYGGTGNDSITGNAAVNNLAGGAGNDAINGAGGNDNLIGGTGDDTYNFSTPSASETDTVVEAAGEGSDYLNFGNISTAVTVNLTSTTVATHTNRTVNATATSAANLEWVYGSTAGDTITGNAANNILNGGPGNDTLTGGAGNDSYNFTTASSAETDTVVEAAAGGSDHLYFASITTAVTVNLTSTTVATHTNRTVSATSTSAANLEWVTGGSAGDTITGNAANNTLNGGNGNDNLYGAGGADTLDGGNGKDRLFGGKDSAADSLVGGADADRFLVPSTATAYDASGLFATAFTYEDSSTDLALDDAEFWLYNQQATTVPTSGGNFTFAAGTWTDTDILNVDSALEKLHLEVAGAELLQNVIDVNHQPIGKLGSQLSGPGTLYGYNVGFTNGDSSLGITLTGNAFANLDQLRTTTIHEMGHNLDAQSENDFIDAFREISDWQFSGGVWSHDPNAEFAHASAEANPFEDFAYTFDSYFMDKYWDNPLGRTLVQDKLDNVQEFLDSLS